jgi:hypothetical protein
MRRFVTNRWWTFILTLGVLLASIAALSSPSFGDGNDPIVITDPAGGTSPGGDPDGPAGPSRQAPAKGRAMHQQPRYAAAPVGDGSSVASVWSWRFHVALRSLISRYVR